MFSDNCKIYIDNVHDKHTWVWDDKLRTKMIERISRWPEEAVPGKVVSVTVGVNPWFYEIVSLSKDEIHLNWIGTKSV